MSEEVYTEITEQSYGNRIKGSMVGIIFGIILVTGACVLLFWNEGRTIKRLKALDQGQSQLVQIQAQAPVDPRNNGKLVYINGLATTTESQQDPEFGITVPGIRLSRKVEMYQWQERKESKTKTNAEGKKITTTTYSYVKGWYGSPRDSSGYHRPDGHENPPMPYESRQFLARKVTIGALQLASPLVGKMTNGKPLALDGVEHQLKIPERYQGRAGIVDNTLYLGGNPHGPVVGDLRISYTHVAPTVVSVIAKQDRGMLEAYVAGDGEIQILATGSHGPDTLFQSAKQSNSILAWGLRLGGWLLMFTGFAMVFAPLTVVASVIPIVGGIIGAGAGLVSFLLASVASLLVVALGWISHRPMLGYTLMALALGILLLFFFRRRKS